MSARSLLRSLWTKSPRELWRRLRGETAPPVWRHAKHRQWNRLPFYLEAIGLFAADEGRPIEFERKRILEFGAGPVLGFAPLLLMEGAASIAQCEPGYVEIRDDLDFQNEYLFPLYSAYRRPRTAPRSFDVFFDRVRQIEIHRGPVESFPADGQPFDLLISKSVLEYVPDVDRFVEKCQALSAPGATQAHYIDFTLIQSTTRASSPFGDLYQTARIAHPEYVGQPGGELNLLRPSDMVRAFGRRYSNVRFLPLVSYAGRVALGKLHADWRNHKPAELLTANGVLLAW